ncbi:MAG: M1 family peptidase, partial [Saprospiraceae bacterium]|nr:M1 family peptidase [Saprospiraceae bacterium]
MRILVILFSFFLVVANSEAQKPYFQQQVNFVIDARLDDTLHQLQGNISMEYFNNSPDTLQEIYLHLWANAFSERNTAFTRQQVRQGSSKFYFAKEEDLGNYSGLFFKVDGMSGALTQEENNPDIGILGLPKPLPPGGKVDIESPFTLKIPASFSRLGHVDDSYQMTQWFPKPAVYDRDGWHAMPYLGMGEYYSEFGNFEVTLTLPENYVVGATGQLV